jgi:long-chain acyl-CoA synthetase
MQVSNDNVDSVGSEFVPTPLRFLQTASKLSDRPAYFVRDDSGWSPTSWSLFSEQVRAAARALIELQVRPGDVVCILGFNRPEWAIMDLAVMSVGAAVAGIYWSSAPVEVEYIVRHSCATLLLVEDQAQYRKIAEVRPCIERLRDVVVMDGDPVDGALAWNDFLALAKPHSDSEIERRIQALKPDDLGCLIYTSGTTGPAKAVMLTHGNLSWVRERLSRLYGVGPEDRLLSYLPMAHIAEQMGAIHNQAESGFTLYYARSVESMADHLAEVRPTMFFGVPRVWEKMRAAIEMRLRNESVWTRSIVRWAFYVARRWHALRLDGRNPGFILGLQKALASKFVHQKLKVAIGLDQARLLITGASSISVDHLSFFCGLDLLLRELYGSSEACGPITLSGEGHTRIGSVGKPFPGVSIRIEDEEIMVNGPNVFAGYLHRPEETRDTLCGGWMATGDLGRIDEDGYLYITGRKKDLIITSGGKNISPANLEADLASIPLVEHAVVCGEGRHYLLALLILKQDMLAVFADQHHMRLDDARQSKVLLHALQMSVDEVNSRHARVENIRRFAVLESALTIASGELTPTLKVRRQVVIGRNSDLIERLYAKGNDRPVI